MILCNKQNGVIVKTQAEDTVFSESFDVIVVGLGTAGAIAAICAAEHGLKVLALDVATRMGGTATSGGVLGYYYGARGGRFEAIDDFIYQTDHDIFTCVNHIYPDHIHSEQKAVVLEQTAASLGVKICYDAWTFGVYLEDKTVVGLQWVDGNGLHSTGASYVIDCTGEADICSIAGCETTVGRRPDGKMQPFSLCTLVVKDGKASSYYVDNGYINANDGMQFSNQILATYTQKMFLKDFYDPDEYFAVIAPQVGVREGRRIIGEENITFDDFINDNMPDKPLFYAHSNIDTHSTEQAFEERNNIEWNIVANLKFINFSVPVSKDVLIPKGYKGILAAGRCIAVDHNISPCVRMKRDMQKCGEAAAAIIYTAIKDKVGLSDVDYSKLKTMLSSTKCLDEENNCLTYRVSEKPDGEKINVPVKWFTDKNDILNSFKNGIPGVGIWSAKRMQNKITSDLRQWMMQEDYNVRICSMFALGLLKDKSCADGLREIIKNRPILMENCNHKEIHIAISAIYLVGKLGDVESITYLTEILRDDEDNDLKNQYFMFAILSLIRILNVSEDVKIKEKISKELQWVYENKKNVYITLNKRQDIHHDLTSQIKRYIEEKWAM